MLLTTYLSTEYMKHYLLSGMMLATAMSLGAAIYRPASFIGEFNDYNIPSTWTMIGRAATPSGDFAPYFDEYSATNSYIVMSAAGLDPTAFSPSQFSDAGRSDEWLITPEFTVASDAELLCFTGVAAGSSVKNNFAVYLSEDGIDKDTFREHQLIKTALQGSPNFNSTTRRIVLEGYAGKKIRLAFVNLDNTTGIFGFNSISVAPYYLNVENPETLENMVLDGADSSMSFKMKVAAPVKVAGLKAVLTLQNGEEYTYEYTGNITSGMFTTITPVFENIDFKGEVQQEYVVTISLNDESLEPTVITGKMVNAERVYPPVVVAEEFTGTWCGYCPLGAAYLSYYTDYYDGSRADGARFFMAAVHDGDPMQAPTSYYSPAMTLAQKYGFSGYPSAMINRQMVVHPAQMDIENIMSQKSFGRLNVNRVDFDANTGAVKISFSPRISFSTPGFGISASVIILENGLKGNNTQWSQTNNFGNFTSNDIAEQLGEEMVPYMAQYVDRPGQSAVPYNQMVYNEVVRGVYPSYDGRILEGPWTADVDRNETLEFTMPLTVSNPEQSALIVVMSNASTGEVISADYVEASGYNKDLSGVQGVASDSGIRLYAVSGKVIAECESEGMVEVYGVDGKVNVRATLKPGRNEVELPAGLCIVNARTACGSAVLKTIN